MADARSALATRVADELRAPASDAALRLAHAVCEAHGASVAAVVFYGSCLRRDTAEGLHDFYAVVDGYRAAHGSRALAWAGAWLPPNVFYRELAMPEGTLRAKVAVVSARDLARGVRPTARRPGLWARLAQPVRAVYVRDPQALRTVTEACVTSLHTAVRFGLQAAPEGADGWRTLEPAHFWPALFRDTYAAELRPEREAAIAGLYAEEAARFDAALRETLAALADAGIVAWEETGGAHRVRVREPWPGPSRRAGRVVAKSLTALQLVKSAFTFGDWLPYVLWKIERHTGTRLEPTPRQRRHPFLGVWPLLFRALRRGALR